MVGEWRDFTVVTKVIKNVASLYGFGVAVSTLGDVCMDFEQCFEVLNLHYVYPKSIKLRQVTIPNIIFHVVSVYRRIG